MKIDLKIDKECFLPVYRKYLNSANLKDINIFYGGVGSGKSYFIATLICIRSLLIPGRVTLVLRKYRSTMDNTVIREIVDALTRLKLIDLVEYNKTKGIITFPNSSKIIMSGYDNPEKIKGVKFADLWMEEITDFSSYADGTNDFIQITERLRGSEKSMKNSRIFISFNPINIGHWVRKEFFSEEDPHKAKYDNIMLCRTTYKDNPFYGDTSKLMRIKNNNPRRWKVVGEGDWGVLGQLIYENFQVFEENFNDKFFDDISFGLDFGFSHYTALVKTGFKNGNIYVLKEIYSPKLTISDLAELIKKTFPEWQHIKIIADSARPDLISELTKMGIYTVPCKKGSGSVLDGIEWLQDRKIYIHKNCKGALMEAESYQWMTDNRTGLILPRPEKTTDDMMDAIRYASEKFKKNDKIEFA